MVERNKTNELFPELENDYSVDENGVVTNLDEIKREKQVLMTVYNELDKLTIEELDEKILIIKEEINEFVQVLDKIAERRNKRFSDAREKEIEEKQRVSTDHFIKTKPTIERPANPPRLPWKEIFSLAGMTLILVLLIFIIFLLSKN